MSSYKNARYFTKESSRGKDDRENFLQLFNRTCNRIYFYSYDSAHNVRDADLVIRDAYIYMYEHIAELRKSKSLDIWQKDCVEKAFRALLRSQRLDLLDDDALVTTTTELSESKKEEIWNSIIKVADIDPWRMVPVPGKSSLFSVLADQTMSDLRYMSVGDIIRSAAIILVICAAAVAAVYFSFKFIQEKRAGHVEPVQEIFLDERYYEDFDLTDAEQVDTAVVDDFYKNALKYDVDEEGNKLVYSFPAAIGDTAASPEYTDDVDVNAFLIDIVKENINDDMSDFTKLETLYEYVGHFMSYSEYEPSGDDDISLIRDCMEYHSGTSQHYAALLDALCEAAGYRTTVIEGRFVLNRGTEFERVVRHYWNRTSLNGIVYYLDVEADTNADGTEIRKYYFMAADGNPRWDIFTRDHVFN